MRKVVIFVVVFLTLMISSCSTSDKNTTANSNISMQMSEMPEPFDSKNNSGGDSLHNYYSKYIFKFGNIDSTLMSLVGEKEANLWIKEHISNRINNDETPEMTVLKFIEHFEIPKDKLIEAVSNSEQSDDWIINLSDIEVIYSKDANLINQTFVNEYALLYNGEIYTPEWLYNHSIEEYAKEGLPIESVNACMAKMSDLPFTEEAQKAIVDKSTNYKRYYENNAVEEQETVVTTTLPENYDEISVSTTAIE